VVLAPVVALAVLLPAPPAPPPLLVPVLLVPVLLVPLPLDVVVEPFVEGAVPDEVVPAPLALVASPLEPHDAATAASPPQSAACVNTRTRPWAPRRKVMGSSLVGVDAITADGPGRSLIAGAQR